MAGSHNEAAFGINNDALSWPLVQEQQLPLPGNNILQCHFVVSKLMLCSTSPYGVVTLHMIHELAGVVDLTSEAQEGTCSQAKC